MKLFGIIRVIRVIRVIRAIRASNYWAVRKILNAVSSMNEFIMIMGY